MTARANPGPAARSGAPPALEEVVPPAIRSASRGAEHSRTRNATASAPARPLDTRRESGSRLLGPGREPQSVLTWPAGNGWLVAKLHEKVRAKLRLGLAVADIAPTSAAGKNGVDVIAIGRAPTAIGIHAQRVIFAAPQFVARAVVRPYRDAPPPHLAAFQYGAWMVANITLSARPAPRVRGEHMMAWDNVLRDSPSLGYVTATHHTGRDHGPTVLTYYHPL